MENEIKNMASKYLFDSKWSDYEQPTISLQQFQEKRIIGEITVVLEGLTKFNSKEFNKSLLKKELNELINAGLTLSAAASYLAKKKNLKKNVIYDLH